MVWCLLPVQSPSPIPISSCSVQHWSEFPTCGCFLSQSRWDCRGAGCTLGTWTVNIEIEFNWPGKNASLAQLPACCPPSDVSIAEWEAASETTNWTKLSRTKNCRELLKHQVAHLETGIFTNYHLRMLCVVSFSPQVAWWPPDTFPFPLSPQQPSHPHLGWHKYKIKNTKYKYKRQSTNAKDMTRHVRAIPQPSPPRTKFKPASSITTF